MFNLYVDILFYNFVTFPNSPDLAWINPSNIKRAGCLGGLPVLAHLGQHGSG